MLFLLKKSATPNKMDARQKEISQLQDAGYLACVAKWNRILYDPEYVEWITVDETMIVMARMDEKSYELAKNPFWKTDFQARVRIMNETRSARCWNKIYY
jgi:hypothetical protein